MKRVIVILVVMLLVAGGAGGLIMLGIVPNPFTPKGAALSASEQAAAAADANKHKFQAPIVAYSIVKIPDLIVPVISGGRVQRRVFITCRIQGTSKEHEKDIKDGIQRFRGEVIDDFVPFLQAYFEQHDALDLLLIKEKLLGHAKHVFGDSVVQDVLLINIFEQNGGGLPPQ